MKNREDQVSLSQDKIKAVNEQLEISEQKLLDFASIPDIEDQLKDRMEVINLTIIVFFKLVFLFETKGHLISKCIFQILKKSICTQKRNYVHTLRSDLNKKVGGQ